MTKYVPIADRIAFQSTSNEMLGVLTKMASQNAGFHIDSIIQVRLLLKCGKPCGKMPSSLAVQLYNVALCFKAASMIEAYTFF